MNRIRVVIDTQTDVMKFVNIANSIEEEVILEDNTHFRADAKSLMGVMYGKFEFKELYVLSEYPNLTSKFIDFMI